MNKTKTTIGFREMSNSKKTILISIFALWICSFVWLIISFTHLDSENPSRKYVLLLGLGLILLTGLLNNLYKRFRNK